VAVVTIAVTGHAATAAIGAASAKVTGLEVQPVRRERDI
jgi:hypothetical protein